MAAPKLFTPTVRTKRGTAAEREEECPIFVCVPTHAEIPVFEGPTDRGAPWNPLRLGGSGGAYAEPVQKRTTATRPQEETELKDN